jgi:hypothetical protein
VAAACCRLPKRKRNEIIIIIVEEDLEGLPWNPVPVDRPIAIVNVVVNSTRM